MEYIPAKLHTTPDKNLLIYSASISIEASTYTREQGGIRHVPTYTVCSLHGASRVMAARVPLRGYIPHGALAYYHVGRPKKYITFETQRSARHVVHSIAAPSLPMLPPAPPPPPLDGPPRSRWRRKGFGRNTRAQLSLKSARQRSDKLVGRKKIQPPTRFLGARASVFGFL